MSINYFAVVSMKSSEFMDKFVLKHQHEFVILKRSENTKALLLVV